MTVKELTKWYSLCLISAGYDDSIKEDTLRYSLTEDQWNKKYPNKQQVQSLMGHIVNTFNAVFDNDDSKDPEIYACWVCTFGVLQIVVDKMHVDIQAMADDYGIEELWKKYKEPEAASAS